MRDVVFRKNSGSREILTPASCIAAIGANHYAMPHPHYIEQIPLYPFMIRKHRCTVVGNPGGDPWFFLANSFEGGT
jgi:hypothetical protein